MTGEASCSKHRTREVLGVRFFDGTTADAVREMSQRGGLLVVPAAPALVNIQYDQQYREALVKADMAIGDSGAMVLLWKLIKREQIRRISGLRYLIRLLEEPELRRDGAIFLVSPSHAAAEKALTWLHSRGFAVEPDDCCVAPRYGANVADPTLARVVEQRRPKHIIVAIGGGVQEKLGLYLRETLTYRPAIHCIGAALGFLTGDQPPIPLWADRLYLGWFLRLVRNPRVYLRRYWLAHALPGLICRYGSELPPLRAPSK